ncbi:MAG: M28 family peptidase [Bacteroidota bacterium]|jgi:aminopeptidase YwaD
MKLFNRISIVFLFITEVIWAQSPADYTGIKHELSKHIRVLSHDSLQGRLAGSINEQKAAAYIIQEFEKAGLKPAGTEGFKQPFPFKRIQFSHRTSGEYFLLTSKQHTLSFAQTSPNEWHELVYPLQYSGQSSFSMKWQTEWAGYGIKDEQKDKNDYVRYALKNAKGKVWVMWYNLPDGNNPHSKYAERWSASARVDSAIAHGATGVIFIAKSGEDAPDYRSFANPERCRSVPVWLMKHISDSSQFRNAVLQSDITYHELSSKAHNVIASINNQADKTIVIGAHYDHLGFDEYGHSTFKTPVGRPKEIHNGADDNASGTSGLIVLGKMLQQKKYNLFNYLFIAFSGEEDGLLGSNFYTRNPTTDFKHMLAMINMDMIGRLDSTKYSLGINGTGTAKEWDQLLSKISIDSLKYKYTASGTGASDHTSFYNMNIPVLHYFTGTHSDYHKPSDDEEKINYDGAAKTITHIAKLIELLHEKPELTFQKTAADSTTRVSFKVTLGIMPDYMYEGKGVRVDGVTEGKPAAVAGIVRDDIIMSIGDYKTTGMQEYMVALSKFKKGDETQVTIMRKNTQLTVKVLF